MMKGKSHDHLFRSTVQFKSRYELLMGEVEYDMKEENVVHGEETESKSTTVFEVAANVWHCV